MPNLGTTELLIIAGVLMLLFGAAKLPKLARSMGESARIFKAETKGIREDDDAESSSTTEGSKAASSQTTSEPTQLPESARRESLVTETVEEHNVEYQKAG